MNKLVLITLLISLTFIGCSSDELDFEQANAIELNPIAKVSLLYFKANPSNFIDQITGLDTPVRFDYSNINVFSNEISLNNVKKVVLKIDIENTFNKDFNIDYYLIDENNNTLDVLNFNSIANGQLQTEYTYLEGSVEFQNMVNTRRINVIVGQFPSTAPTNDAMLLHFKSAVDLTLKFGND
ncbi:MAG: hypothetical protein V3U80_00755 [Flavobacteriaceae bacterium]